MSGNLSKAKKLLTNEDANMLNLEKVLADLEITLTTNNHNMDGRVKSDYAKTISLLTNRISEIKTSEKKAKTEKQAEYHKNRKTERFQYNPGRETYAEPVKSVSKRLNFNTSPSFAPMKSF